MVDKSDLIIDKIDLVHSELKEHKEAAKAHYKKSDDRHDDTAETQEAHDERITKLEKPREFLKSLKSVALYVAAIAGAYLTVTKVLERLGGA